MRSSLNDSQRTYHHWHCLYVSAFLSSTYRGLYIWKTCQIFSVKYFYQHIQWHPTWWMFVLWSLWSLFLVNVHLFFCLPEQLSPIVPLHFLLLLLVLICSYHFSENLKLEFKLSISFNNWIEFLFIFML